MAALQACGRDVLMVVLMCFLCFFGGTVAGYAATEDEPGMLLKKGFLAANFSRNFDV